MILTMLEIAFKSSLILGVTFAVALLANKQSAAFRHWLWTAGLFSALIAPLLGMVLPAWHPKIATFAVDSVKSMNAAIAPSKAVQSITAAAAQHPMDSGTPAAVRRPAPSLQWILITWVLGAGLVGVLLLVEILKLFRVAWHSKPVADRGWRDLADDIASAYRLKRSVKLLWNARSSALGTWGTFRPRILLPREIEQWSEERRRVVLAHELAHVKRNDWLLQLLAETARVVYWFNPLFWLACARLRRESEFACDDAALNLGIDGPSYAEHLLDLVRTLKHSGTPRTAALAMAGTSNLERRLVAMLNPSRNRRSVGKGTVTALLILTSALTLPIAAMQGQSSVPISIEATPLVAIAIETVPPPTSRATPPVEEEVAPAAAIEEQTAPAPPPKAPATVAMVVLIDVSGSMSQGQLTVAKNAAKAALKGLRDSDRFGTIEFNTSFSWAAPLQPAANRDAIGAQIDRIYAAGGTNIYVGLNAAYNGLKDAKEDVKHVILLSDGITQNADFQTLATTMLNAGITVSSVSVGVNSNRVLMENIATWTKGRAWYSDSFAPVPEILAKDAELAVNPLP